MKLVLGVELHRTAFRFTAPLLAILGGVIAILNSYPLIATWSNISDVMLETGHFLAPFVAGLAAWEALRAPRRRMQVVEHTSALPAPYVRLPQMLSALIWVGGAWMAIFVAVFVRASIIGLYGAPEVVTLLHSLILPLAFVVIGMSIANLLPTWVAVPISVLVSVALYAATLFGGLPDVVTWTNIFAQYVSIDGATSNQLFFLALLVETLALAAAFAVLTMARFRPYRYASILLATVGVAALIAGGGVAIGQRGQDSVQIPASSMPMVTVTNADRSVELRLLEHYGPVSDELLTAWTRVASIVGDSDLAFTTLTQQIDVDHLGAPAAVDRLYLNPDSRDIVSDSIQSSLYDVMSCYRDAEAQPQGSFGVEGTVVVESWLQGRTSLAATAWTSNPDVTAALAWLNSLTTADAKAWVKEHAGQIRSCSWERGDFDLS